MGCCYSCEEDRSPPQGGEVNERTHLLVNPVSNNTLIQRDNSDDFLTRYPNSVPKRTDEQTALNKILQETATNVIDVAALDSHNLEQHEYNERMRHYTHRMAKSWSNIKLPSLRRNGLLADIGAPEKELSKTPITVEDRKLIEDCVEKGLNALKRMTVEHKEDLVVPFRIP